MWLQAGVWLGFRAGCCLLAGAASGCLGSGFGDANRLPAEEVELLPCENGERLAMSISVPATAGLSEADLGRPADNNLQLLEGADNTHLFETVAVHTTEPREFRHSYQQVATQRELRAMIGIAYKGQTAGYGAEWGRGKSFATHTVAHVRKTVSIDDTAAWRRLPEGAVFFLHRLHFGAAYQVILSGDKKTFNTKVSGLLASFSGFLEDYSERHKIDMQTIDQGCAPKGEGTAAVHSSSGVEQNYDCSGDDRPILAEFRSIPIACVPESEALPWEPAIRAEVRFPKISTGDPGCQGRDGGTPWTLAVECSVNDQPVRFSNPDLFTARFLGPGEYETDFVEYLYVVPGDTIVCGTRGEEADCDNELPLIEHTYVVKDWGENDTYEAHDSVSFPEGDYTSRIRLRFDESEAPSGVEESSDES